MQRHASVLALSASLIALGAALPHSASAAAQDNKVPGVAGPQSDSVRAAHVLNRLTFGARPGDFEKILSIGVEKWIQQQLRPETIDDSLAQKALAQPAALASGDVSGFFIRAELVQVVKKGDTVPAQKGAVVGARKGDSVIVLQRSDGQTMVAMRTDSLRKRLERVVFLAKGRFGVDNNAIARVTRSETSERQLLEVVTDFWLNHFSVFTGKMPSRTATAQYEQEVIRPNALGKFRDLLGAVAHSPAMLFYLDNHLSNVDAQHLALPEYRTFLSSGRRSPAPRKTGLNENYARELLELHTLGVDGGYSQTDVIEVARAFTGWSIGTPVASGGFTFKEASHDADEKRVLGVTLAAGRGIEDGEQVLDIVANHPSTARFIAKKLAVRLVSDSPPESLIARAAERFTQTNGDIRAVVETIVTSEEFFAGDAFRSKVKSPYELVLSMRRAMGLAPDRSSTSASLPAEMGQPSFGKETPDGWPETGSAWMTSGAMFNRVGLAMRISSGEIPEFAPDSSATWRALAEAPFEKQLDAVVSIVFAGTVSRETREALASIKPAANSDVVSSGRERLQQLLAMAFSAPEFQRR